MKKSSAASTVVVAIVFVLFAAFPLITPLLGIECSIGFVRRVLVVALAAASLNFILGFGGMVALGHAGFIGTGAYTVVALSAAGMLSAWVLWPTAALVAGVVAALVGSVTLRTRGVYFIMTTLAFAQMLCYVVVSLRRCGATAAATVTRCRHGRLFCRASISPTIRLSTGPCWCW